MYTNKFKFDYSAYVTYYKFAATLVNAVAVVYVIDNVNRNLKRTAMKLLKDNLQLRNGQFDKLIVDIKESLPMQMTGCGWFTLNSCCWAALRQCLRLRCW